MNFRLLWLAPVLLSSGCVLETVQPLSDPLTAKPDEKMYGRWLVKDAGIETYLFIGKHYGQGDNPESIMEYTSVTWNPKRLALEAPDKKLYFTVTRIGQTSYANIFFEVQGKKGEVPPDLLLAGSYKRWASNEKRYCAILRYFCDGQKLQLWTDKNGVHNRLVKEKLLEIAGKKVATDSLVKYLEKNGGDVLFDTLMFEAKKLP